MSFVSKETELSEFIDSKRISPKKMVVKEVLVNYAKILKDIILITYRKFENPIWSNEAVTIVSHIFWQSIYYTFNIRLAMFLSDRAIILFNEYIEIIKSTYTNESEFNINKTDIKLYIYKRTIGPIHIIDIDNTNLSILNHLKRIEHVSNEFRQIVQKIFLNLIQYYEYTNKQNTPISIREEQIIQYIDYAIKIYIHILYKLSLYNKYTVIDYDWKFMSAILNRFIEIPNNLLSYLNLILNIIKIEYDLIYYTITKYKELHLEITSKLTNFLNFIREELTIEDIIFNDKNHAIFNEMSKFLTDEQTTNPHKLLFYKAQKKNIVKFHSTHI
jgi:hypothetical protein